VDIEAFLAAERLTRDYVQTIERIHVPLANAIVGRCADAATLVVGLCGPQGSGKSTMALALAALLQDRGVSSAILSLDDLYLMRAERARLARDVHPLLAARGVPGTHDVELGLATLRALREPGRVALPRFDKATDDRLPREVWRQVAAPVQVVLFEGWCVGARTQESAALMVPVNALERDEDPERVWRTYVNESLGGAYQQLFAEIDALILLQPPGFEVVYAWRCEQEHKLRERADIPAAECRVMSDAQIARFVAHFERLTRHILAEMPARADAIVTLGERREPLGLVIRGKLA
jgi:D-glycerate 3-kinase